MSFENFLNIEFTAHLLMRKCGTTVSVYEKMNDQFFKMFHMSCFN